MPRDLASGQHSFRPGGGCISTLMSGAPCKGPRVVEQIPYCTKCMHSGDPSLRVTKHPKFGKILVARRQLPAGYIIAWWGTLYRKGQKIPDEKLEWALDTGEGTTIDGTNFPGSLLKFSACPGPGEIATLGYYRTSDALLGNISPSSVLFVTKTEIPIHTNLTMTYASPEKGAQDKFFSERGLDRCDVGTADFPALRKKAHQAQGRPVDKGRGTGSSSGSSRGGKAEKRTRKTSVEKKRGEKRSSNPSQRKTSAQNRGH